MSWWRIDLNKVVKLYGQGSDLLRKAKMDIEPEIL